MSVTQDPQRGIVHMKHRVQAVQQYSIMWHTCQVSRQDGWSTDSPTRKCRLTTASSHWALLLVSRGEKRYSATAAEACITGCC